MSYGPVKVFSVGIASGASTSSYMDLGKSNTRMAVKYVTMSTGCVVSVFGSESATGTYLPVFQLVPSTATVALQAVQIATGASGGWGVIEAVPFQYIQLVTTAVVSGGVSFTVLTSD